MEIPWLGGTTTVTRLEVSPLAAYMTLEGGSCGEYVAHMNSDPISEGGETMEFGDLTITFGATDIWGDKRKEMIDSLTAAAGMTFQDSTQIPLGFYVDQEYGYREGPEGLETPYVLFSSKYNSGKGSWSVLDPAQVDHVTVCGVDIPLASQEDGGSAAPDQTAEPSAMEGVVSAKKGLNVRSGPGTRFRVLTAVPKGARLDILGEESGFYQVGLPGGEVGYASKNHISVE